MASLIKIDGSLGEGGGQVLRIALSLSALFEIPIEIDNIRAGRPKPGLAAQHLAGVELAKELCNATVSGGFIGSTKIEFHPGKLSSKKTHFEANIGTAGCICLLIQVSLPCVLFMKTENTVSLTLKGGTNVPFGPQIEYFNDVFRPFLQRFGADFECHTIRKGFYPKGGGKVELKVKPVKNLNSVEVSEPGQPDIIQGRAFVAGAVKVPEAVTTAKDATENIKETLTKHDLTVPSLKIESQKEDPDFAVGHGSGINIFCKTSSGCVFGGSGLITKKDRNTAGTDAAKEILNPILTKSCVDEHTQDQMIIYMALAKGRSRVCLGDQKLTSHTETAIKVAELILGPKGLKFNLSREKGDGPFILECDGLGLVNDLHGAHEL